MTVASQSTCARVLICGSFATASASGRKGVNRRPTSALLSTSRHKPGPVSPCSSDSNCSSGSGSGPRSLSPCSDSSTNYPSGSESGGPGINSLLERLAKLEAAQAEQAERTSELNRRIEEQRSTIERLSPKPLRTSPQHETGPANPASGERVSLNVVPWIGESQVFHPPEAASSGNLEAVQNHLSFLREFINLTQKDLAEHVCYVYKDLQNIHRRINTTTDTSHQYMLALEKRVQYLEGAQKEPSSAVAEQFPGSENIIQRAVETMREAVDKRLLEVETKVGELGNKFPVVEAKVGDHDTKLASHQRLLQAQEAGLKHRSERLDVQFNYLVDLKQNLEGHGGHLVAHEEQLLALQNQVKELTSHQRNFIMGTKLAPIQKK